MEKILSQDEIDALLRGMEDGKVETAPEETDRSGVIRFDFANQDRIIRGRMPTLEIVNDHFSRLFRNTLSSALRKIIDVNATGIHLVKFGEFMRGLPVPSSLHVLKLEPLRGHALLVLESKLVFTLLDIFFGGSGKSGYRIEGRDFTAIESRLIQRIVSMVFTDLEKALNSAHPIKIQYVRSEINPQFVTIVPPSDIVITIPFGVELEHFTGTITLCIPYSVIEPIKAKLYSGYQSDQLELDQSWITRFIRLLKSVEVDLTVELGRGQMTTRELMHLKVGDTFTLKKEVSEPLVAMVETIPKFLGRAGVYGANKAIQIEQKI